MSLQSSPTGWLNLEVRRENHRSVNHTDDSFPDTGIFFSIREQNFGDRQKSLQTREFNLRSEIESAFFTKR